LDSKEKQARLLAEDERLKMKAGIDIAKMQTKYSTIHHG